jgi:hypothetical protein
VEPTADGDAATPRDDLPFAAAAAAHATVARALSTFLYSTAVTYVADVSSGGSLELRQRDLGALLPTRHAALGAIVAALSELPPSASLTHSRHQPPGGQPTASGVVSPDAAAAAVAVTTAVDDDVDASAQDAADAVPAAAGPSRAHLSTPAPADSGWTAPAPHAFSALAARAPVGMFGMVTLTTAAPYPFTEAATTATALLLPVAPIYSAASGAPISVGGAASCPASGDDGAGETAAELLARALQLLQRNAPAPGRCFGANTAARVSQLCAQIQQLMEPSVPV